MKSILALTRVLIILLFIGFALALFPTPGWSQSNLIYRFKDVAIPFGFRCQEMVIEKGACTIEFYRHTITGEFSVKMKMKNRIICEKDCRRIPYADGQILTPKESAAIPKSPTLKLKRDLERNELVLDFESGLLHPSFPLIRLRCAFPI